MAAFTCLSIAKTKDSIPDYTHNYLKNLKQLVIILVQELIIDLVPHVGVLVWEVHPERDKKKIRFVDPSEATHRADGHQGQRSRGVW